MTAQPAPLRCHRCGSADLILYETAFEHSGYAGGLFVDEQGDIKAHGSAYHEAGEIQPQMTRIKCDSCGHSWHPRRRFAGTELPGTGAGPDCQAQAVRL